MKRVFALFLIAALPWELTEWLRCRFEWHDEPDFDPEWPKSLPTKRCIRCKKVFEL